MKKWLALLLGVAMLFTFCFTALAEEADDEEAADDEAVEEEAIDEEAADDEEVTEDAAEKSYAEEINPHGYKLIHITDVFTVDPEVDENGDPIGEAEGPVVQCSFGDIDLSDESNPEFIGFEKESEDEETAEGDEASFEGETFTLGLAPDCELLLPTDFENPTENHKVEIEDFEEWAEELAKVKGVKEFYATFEMDDEGNLTKIEYFWTPFD